MEPSLTWVIGRGGLLGQSLERAIGSSELLWRPPESIVWSATDAGGSQLRRLAGQFLHAAGERPWSVAWCAGTGTVGTSAQDLRLELEALRNTLAGLDAVQGKSTGTFFFASSAGAVYAGVGHPPYDESSPVRPLTAYGRAKLEAEDMVTAWSRRAGTPALIGRIANIYGPGQNIAKAQGLISQVCRSYLVRQPQLIYVSLDTLRDYLFAPDCANLIVEGLSRLRDESATSHSMVVTKILATQRAVTVGAVLGEMRRIFKNMPRTMNGASLASSVQVRDLSLRSRIWPELDRHTLTPFPVGVAITAEHLRQQLQRGEL
jgi:UDP-glucose 4-epimerase